MEKTQCLSKWADEMGISKPTLTKRLKEGLTIKEALCNKLNYDKYKT